MTSVEYQVKGIGILNHRFDSLNEFQIMRKIDGELYHYTSATGLVGILKSDSFWVTRSDFLNDSSEIKYFSEVISKVLNELKDMKEVSVNRFDTNGNFYSIILLKLIDDLKSEFNSDFYSHVSKTTYILSLSENSDSTTLFGNYSKFEGYNIGMKSSDLIRAFDRQVDKGKYSFLLHGKVIYNEKNQVDIIIKEVLDAYNALFEIMDGREINLFEEGVTEEVIDNIMTFLRFKLGLYSLFFKHPLFSHEEEYRIAFGTDTSESINSEFRTMDSVIIPFLDIKIDKIPIKSITIGPKNNIDIAESGVQSFLESLKHKEVNVSRSQIPLRF